MKSSHSGHSATRPKTVRAAQLLIWAQFTAIVGLYGLGLEFLRAATASQSSADTMGEALLSGGIERWFLVLISIGVTVSLPVIAVQLGRRKAKAVSAAWYALAFVPFCMFVWVVARAYLATFPDEPQFFVGVGAMLLICGSLPTVILLCLASKSSHAWFDAAEAVSVPAQAPAQERELVGSGAR